MIVSWNWLRDYVPLDLSPEELADRFTMSGLNLGDQGILKVGGDFAIDVEVTSNRPDCLGHIGIAREAAVLLGRPLKVPHAAVTAGPEKTASVTSVAIESPDLCPRYTARVLRGVKIGPSPKWLIERLQAATRKVKYEDGREIVEEYRPINNVVDITNYVMLECGQPLHAFDFDKLRGRRIVVRRARPGEKITAIDQKEYALDPEMCVIADAERPVAIGGVMGGHDTEIGDATTNVLIEVAEFTPMSIRATARRLKLHSPSSYRFERFVDPRQLDWASRRCCELILQIAGGELLDEAVAAGAPAPGDREPVTLRFSQIRRVLGIDVPADEAVRILESLGLRRIEGIAATQGVAGIGAQRSPQPSAHAAPNDQARFIPPSWRRDLSREADLIEEIARVHGYDKIPQDVPVPLTISARTHRDRVADRVRSMLTAAGFFEAVTFSFIPDRTYELAMPYGDRPRIRLQHDDWSGEVLRQSLVPSLLISRRENEKHRVSNAQLFEIAPAYLAATPGGVEREVEPTFIGLVTGRSFGETKGVLEELARQVNPAAIISAEPLDRPDLAPGRGALLKLDGQPWGWLGELARSVTDPLDLHDAVTAAEVQLAVLEDAADLVPSAKPLPTYPAIERDLNFVLDELTSWDELASIVRGAAGPLAESLDFAGQYRGKQIPEGKKSYIVRVCYRAPDRTLTADEVDTFQQNVIKSCEGTLKATLR